VISFFSNWVSIRRALVALGAVATLVACAGPEKSKPAELPPLAALVGIKTAWTSTIGAVGFPLQVKVQGNAVYLAGSDGGVAVIDARTGGDIWRVALGVPLSAGVGTDGQFVAVVSRENDLIVLKDGREAWRKKLDALTVTAPLVAGKRVFVLSSDRAVSAFDAASGNRLWQQQRTGEALVLAQSGVIEAVGDTLVAGLGGRLVGLNPANGVTRWSAPIATGRGTNEIERLVDLVAGVSRFGDQLCVRSFQAAVGCVDVNKNRVIWSKSASGFTGVQGDQDALFGTEKSGKVWSWRRADGEVLWTSDTLRFRSLSAPLLLGRLIAVGDDSGTLHFLSRADAEPLNRLYTDGSPIAVTPVLVGKTVVVVTQRGGVFGFRPE
jgi:outer membrane protein assembly factor BamB